MKVRERLQSRICDARRHLRHSGQQETMDAVVEIVGGSKSTIAKYWDICDPADHPRPVPTAPVPDLEAAFHETFAAYVAAARAYVACQGLVGNEREYPYLVKASRHVPLIRNEYNLPRRHPLVEQLEARLKVAYDKHLSAWDNWRACQDPAPGDVTVVTSSAQPVAPKFTLENLRRYFQNERTSPWPNGAALPLTAMPLLDTLWAEYDAQVAKAERAKYAVLNSHTGGQASLDAALMPVEDQRGTAALMCYTIERERQKLRARAHDEGVAV